MTKDWKHVQLKILCLALDEPSVSRVFWPEHGEWQQWAVGIHRGAIKKVESLRGTGPMLVSAWLAMRASLYGWEDLFRFWAERAHAAGDLKRSTVESSVSLRLGRALAIEERIAIARNRFHKSYEESFGYPIRCSPRGKTR